MTHLFFVAEVMDKEPTIVVVWVCSVLVVMFGAVAAALRWWAGLIFVAVAALLSIAMLMEIYDPFVGPAIRLEAGRGYVFQVHAAAIVAIAIPLLAVISAKRRGTANAQSNR